MIVISTIYNGVIFADYFSTLQFKYNFKNLGFT